MNYLIAFLVVVIGQVVMHLIFPDSPVSRMDVVFGAFFGLLMLWGVTWARAKP
ncbi:hypothetical protein FHR70_000712 [Microvirga lupini]|uniref:Uncharacterized protein n=1 Tax=Microvirga lupini TaxID=420324 RepID=A0A7W4VJC4_9HYPH|nr:hypothetical protein [Microvirga lupini]MBB3017672.1 hypothetical protein [Microvirga lupini]